MQAKIDNNYIKDNGKASLNIFSQIINISKRN